jgi:hypothetical protein
MNHWMAGARLGRIDRQRCRVVGVVDKLAPGLPDERGEPDQAVLDAEAVEVGQAIAVGVFGQRLGGREEVVPAPAGRRQRHPSRLEPVAVVVDDEAGEVLRQADELAVPGERRQRLRVVGAEVEPGRLQRGADSGQDVPRRELPVASVVDQEDVGRAARGEAGREPGVEVGGVGDVGDPDIDRRVGRLERLDQDW